MSRIFLLCAMLSTSALGQYDGPAVEACRAYAAKETAQRSASRPEVVFDRDRNLVIERYTRKVGSQFVSSVLAGNGAVVYAGVPSAELSFICLLADDKNPVYFGWLARQDVPALVQCLRDPGLRGKPRPCLETLLQVAENELTELYAHRFQLARERDVAAGAGDKALDAHRKSNEAWRLYRDAECARRRDEAPPGAGPDDVQLACRVELTRRRALDLR